MAIRILSSENITGNLTLSGNQTTGGNAYVTGTSNSLVVISRDNMFVDAGQFYLGADDGTTDDSFRQRTASGSYFIESRKSGTWTNRLQINTAGTLIVQQGMAISGNIDGVGATFIGTAASGAALVTIENNSGSTATSYGLLVLGGGNSSNGRTFEVRDASGNTDLIVKGDGNVGIGTATPEYQFQIYNTGIAEMELKGNPPEFNLYDTSGTADKRRARLTVDSTRVSIQGLNDADNTVTHNFFEGDLNSGNVGIGTTSPDYKLDVRNGELTVRPSSSGNVGLGKIGHSSNNAILQLYDSLGNEDVRISTSLNSYFNGGNVGIGTTSPSAKLDIGLGTLGNNGLGGLRIFDDATHFWMLIRKNSVGATRLSLYHGQGSVPLVFQEGGGNVGIGTTSPTEKLSVSGNIELDDMPANGTRYLMTNETNTGTGRLNIQAGGGSAAYGGGLSLIANSHASKPGWVIAGISSGAGTAGGATEGRFVVNTHGLGTGSDLFTVLRTGNVGIGTASPGGIFEVFQQSTGRTRGDLLVDAGAKYVYVGRLSTTSGDVSSFKVRDRLNRAYFDVNTASKYISFNPEVGDITMQIASGYGFKVNGGQFNVNASSGSVGIGTTTPDGTLHVVGKVNTNRIVSGNLIAGNIRSNLTTTTYLLLVDLNVSAGFSLVGELNAASYTTYNVSRIYIRKNYNATTGAAVITGIAKSGSNLSVVDISHSSGRFIAIKLTGDPEIDVMWTGYRLNDQFNSDGTIKILTSGVTENSVYASY